MSLELNLTEGRAPEISEIPPSSLRDIMTEGRRGARDQRDSSELTPRYHDGGAGARDQRDSSELTPRYHSEVHHRNPSQSRRTSPVLRRESTREFIRAPSGAISGNQGSLHLARVEKGVDVLEEGLRYDLRVAEQKRDVDALAARSHVQSLEILPKVRSRVSLA